MLLALLMLAAVLAVYSEPGRQWFQPLPPPQPAAQRPGNASHDDLIAARGRRQDTRQHGACLERTWSSARHVSLAGASRYTHAVTCLRVNAGRLARCLAA